MKRFQSVVKHDRFLSCALIRRQRPVIARGLVLSWNGSAELDPNEDVDENGPKMLDFVEGGPIGGMSCDEEQGTATRAPQPTPEEQVHNGVGRQVGA